MIRTDLIKPIDSLLSEKAARHPDKPAFQDRHRAVSYRELDERTRNVAGHLTTLGVGSGDRIALFLGNSVEAVEGNLAAVRMGAVAVPINPRSSPSEADYMLATSSARVAIVDAAHLEAVLKVAANSRALRHVILAGAADDERGTLTFERLAADEPPQSSVPGDRLDDPAWMVYTSGTTGRPKGVMLSQRGCLWVVAACWAPIVGLCADDLVLSPLPLFHSYAIDLCIAGVLAVGATEYVCERFRAPDVLDLLSREPITLMPGVPTMFHRLLEAARDRGLGCPTLRTCVSAGAIMPVALNREFEQTFAVPVLDGYGITETSTMVTMNWPDGTRVMGSCGLPVPGTAVRIVDPATGRDVDSEHDGELWVRGPQVMLGYHENRPATREALAGGWYHTGDLAHTDHNGYITITGRIKELIIRGGENIYPAEVEAALAGSHQVLDVAVAGQPDEELGETVVAYVVARNPPVFDERQLRQSCAKRLAPYKLPTRIELIDEIPRTGSGKVMRHKLAALIDQRNRNAPATTTVASLHEPPHRGGSNVDHRQFTQRI
jgi:rifamycin polyketide synthase module 1/2/3